MGGNEDKEKAIYRLTRIGVFKDYTVNFGSYKFTIDIHEQTLQLNILFLYEYLLTILEMNSSITVKSKRHKA